MLLCTQCNKIMPCEIPDQPVVVADMRGFHGDLFECEFCKNSVVVITDKGKDLSAEKMHDLKHPIKHDF
jgi:hypothetical protein